MAGFWMILIPRTATFLAILSTLAALYDYLSMLNYSVHLTPVCLLGPSVWLWLNQWRLTRRDLPYDIFTLAVIPIWAIWVWGYGCVQVRRRSPKQAEFIGWKEYLQDAGFFAWKVSGRLQIFLHPILEMLLHDFSGEISWWSAEVQSEGLLREDPQLEAWSRGSESWPASWWLVSWVFSREPSN